MPIARHDLPEDHFPFTILALSTQSGKVVWERTVTGPGPVYIPALAKRIGCPVTIRMVWPDGPVTEQEPVGRP